MAISCVYAYGQAYGTEQLQAFKVQSVELHIHSNVAY